MRELGVRGPRFGGESIGCPPGEQRASRRTAGLRDKGRREVVSDDETVAVFGDQLRGLESLRRVERGRLRQMRRCREQAQRCTTLNQGDRKKNASLGRRRLLQTVP